MLSWAERNSERYEHARARRARARQARHTTPSFTPIFEFSFYYTKFSAQEKLFLKHTTRASPARAAARTKNMCHGKTNSTSLRHYYFWQLASHLHQFHTVVRTY
jgi:hypothetical protein